MGDKLAGGTEKVLGRYGWFGRSGDTDQTGPGTCLNRARSVLFLRQNQSSMLFGPRAKRSQ